jgi:RNA polymerase sigma factor (sigma-70 family)
MRPTPADPASTASAAPDDCRWFSDEVRPHEASLRSYLRGRFPGVRDVDDVVQESYLRIWRARAAQPIRCAQAFLFTVARRLALDTLRHERASPIEVLGRLDDLRVIADTPDAAEVAGRRERVRLLAEAIAALPARCREVFLLHKIQGHSRRETARCLGLAEKTVEAQTAKAIQRCRHYLRRRGVTALFEP